MDPVLACRCSRVVQVMPYPPCPTVVRTRLWLYRWHRTAVSFAMVLGSLLLPTVAPSADRPAAQESNASTSTASASTPQLSADTKQTATYRSLRKEIDSIRAIDTHDHLEFDTVAGLYTLWRESYFGIHIPPMGPRNQHIPVNDWWDITQRVFKNGRTMSFYRYQTAAFRDLYGVDFDRLTMESAEQLDAAIRARYRDPNWIRHVVLERAKVDMLLIDYDYTPYDYVSPWDFGVAIVRLNPLIRGFHAEEYGNEAESPYSYANRHGLPLKSIDDYCAVLDHILHRASERGAVGMKSTLAYARTLRYDQVSREQAAQAFGKRRSELTPEQVKSFEDYVFWQLCDISAKYDMPFQIHTGLAMDRSNPMHLENVIQAHPNTTFILFHGGYPWIGETGMLLMRFPKNVWIDSNWLPLVSYSAAKRAYHEWLDVVPSNRIMWGTDTLHAEGLYGATVMTRQCLAEVLAERVDRGDVSAEHAQHIARQILRENALEAFPRLRRRMAAERGATR